MSLETVAKTALNLYSINYWMALSLEEKLW